MVQISTAVIAAVTAFSSLAAATLCSDDMMYCGSRLAALDNVYPNEIIQQLQLNGLPTTATYKQDSVFICNPDGTVTWDAYCGQGQCYVDTRWGDQCPS